MLVLRFKVSASQAPVLQLSNHFISLSPQLRAATLGCRRDDGLTLGRYPRSRSITGLKIFLTQHQTACVTVTYTGVIQQHFRT